jgi:hypothetical protein
MIDVTLNVINNKTQETQTYEALLEPEGYGEIILKGINRQQKLNEIVDIIENTEDTYSLEVSYKDKIAHATYELEFNCIMISEDAKKRLLSNSKKLKK